MLIAMMARTFDVLWEASATHHQVLFAREVFFSSQRPPEPPPLYFLRFPWYFILYTSALLQKILPSRAVTAHRHLRSVLLWVEKGFDYSTNIGHTSDASTNLNQADEYVGTVINGHNTFVNWCRSMTEQELRQMLEDFVTTHQDEDAAEDRWRTKMLKRITGAIHEQTQSIEERIDLQQKTLEQMQYYIKRLLGEKAGSGTN